MSLTFHWFLTTQGDTGGIARGGDGAVGDSAWRMHEPASAYLAQAVEQVGFEGERPHTAAWCQDAWSVIAILVKATNGRKFPIALRCGSLSSTLAGQMAATYQRCSEGRLLINVVAGGESTEQRTYGDLPDKSARYTRTGDFLQVGDRLCEGRAVGFHGEHIQVKGTARHRRRVPHPPVCFGGSSAAALDVALSHVDTYLAVGEPPGAVADRTDGDRALTTKRVRTLDAEACRGDPEGPEVQ